jgi:hypothetical protein
LAALNHDAEVHMSNGYHEGWSNYRTFCMTHSYADEYTHEWDYAMKDRELHIANNPDSCENDTEIHEITDASGTYAVRMDGAGNQHW